MVELLSLAERAAESSLKVLITGESGVGKDLVARHVHSHSARKQSPFVAVNCAGLTESLLESELFGHVKGSFTGAYRDKRGKLQLAHRGTLFLDEVGEMSLRMQALLLRFLENGEIQAVGADHSQARVDVRVVAATNRNLDELVTAGQFREDLLYRLRVIHLHVPPLRERTDDVHQLPHVAGPSISLNRAKRVTAEVQASLGSLQKVRHQGVHVFRPLSKGRHVQVDDAQPVQQVFAKLAGGNELGQIAIRRGDDANIGRPAHAIGADRLDFAGFEKPE